MRKYLLFLFLFLISCGGGSGDGSTNSSYSLTPIISGLGFPVRIEELPSGKLLIAELASGRLYLR